MKILYLALLIILPYTAQSQSVGDWIMYFGNQKISNRFNFHNEIQYRNYNAIGDLEQLLIRGGIGYNLSENNNNLLLGYGFIQSEVEGKNEGVKPIIEHRVFEQFITNQQFGRFSLSHRYRFEQRFVSSSILYRFRYFLAAKMALNKPIITSKTFYVAAYNEVFLGPTENPFDRNRLYGALGYAFKKQLKVELGFMSQLFSSYQSPQFQIAVFNSLDFFKTKQNSEQ